MGTDWIFYVFLSFVSIGIFVALRIGFEHRKEFKRRKEFKLRKEFGRVWRAVNEDIKEERLIKEGIAAQEDQDAPPELLRRLQVNCFVFDNGRYRLGDHRLCEGFDEEKLAKLCRIVNGWIESETKLIGFTRHCGNGDLVVERNLHSKDGIIINKNVQARDYTFTVESFAKQVNIKAVKP